MYKILFDDNFYNNTLEQRDYFDRVLNIIKQNFDVQIAYFVPFSNSVKTFHYDSMHQLINRKIFDTEIVEKYDLNNVNETSDDILENQMGFSQLFIGKLKCIKEKNPNTTIIVPLCFSEKNKKLNSLQHLGYLFYIGNIDGEVNSNIAKWIQNDTVLHIDFPSKDNYFQAGFICEGYNVLRGEILHSFENKEVKEANFREIGMEVAFRNQFVFDQKLTSLNRRKSRSNRCIFKSKGNFVLYLSIDFENGGFEVFDKKANPKGQYRFNGTYEKDNDDGRHILYLK